VSIMLLSTGEFIAGARVKAMLKRWCGNGIRCSLVRTFRDVITAITTVTERVTRYWSWEHSNNVFSARRLLSLPILSTNPSVFLFVALAHHLPCD